MTRIAYLDPVGGISGDMLLAALLDAGGDRSVVDDTVESLRLEGVELSVERTSLGDLSATQVTLRVAERAEARSATSMLSIVAEASLPERCRSLAIETLHRLARAEAEIHGVTDLDDVVLHELGGDDTLVDICCAFALLDTLKVDRVVSAPLPVGRGVVAGSHGPLPAPAPATLSLLRGVPLEGVATPGELVTPTAAAIVSTVVEAFGELPPMMLETVGVGAGSARHRDRPNVLRVLFGTPTAEPARGEIVLLEANLDDLTPELAPDAQDACVAAGAIDTWLTPLQMKKGRPGFMLSVLARPAAERSVAEALLRHTSTLGVRVQRVLRYELDRATREVTVDGRTIRVKIGLLRGRVVNVAPEHDDCAAIARDVGRPVKEVWAEALAAARAALEAPVESDELTR